MSYLFLAQELTLVEENSFAVQMINSKALQAGFDAENNSKLKPWFDFFLFLFFAHVVLVH